jgi:hypothetical protein
MSAALESSPVLPDLTYDSYRQIVAVLRLLTVLHTQTTTTVSSMLNWAQYSRLTTLTAAVVWTVASAGKFLKLPSVKHVLLSGEGNFSVYYPYTHYVMLLLDPIRIQSIRAAMRMHQFETLRLPSGGNRENNRTTNPSSATAALQTKTK